MILLLYVENFTTSFAICFREFKVIEQLLVVLLRRLAVLAK